jgi:hypothetical protein
MLRRHVVNLCVTLIPVHIREHPAFSLFQVRTDAFRNPAQLFATTFFRYPGLSVFDPGIEVKMWISIHWFYVLLKRFAFAGRKGFVGTAGMPELGRCTTPARSRRESKRNRRAIHQGFLADSMGFDGATGILSTQLQ